MRRRPWMLAAAALSLAALVAWAAPPPGEGPSRPGHVRGADLPLLEAVRAIAADVERLRGQRFDRPPLAVRVPDDMREVAAEIRAGDVLDWERLAARGRAWRDIGLGEPESPRILLRRLAGDLEGIGFDPQSNRLLVAPDRLSAEDFGFHEGDDARSTILLMTGVRRDEPLAAHLLMHVRQRERIGGELLTETTDRTLARMAWFEGEANLVAVRYLFGGMGLADDILTADLDPGDLLDGALLPADLEGQPQVVRAFLQFVYREGFAQVAEHFRAGGWEALERAMARCDATRDLLHPDAPPVAAPSFPEPAAPAPGLELADEDVIGEQGVVILVSQATGKDSLGLVAGDGWVGDRLRRFEPPDGEPGRGVTRWLTRWKSAPDAEDFAYSLDRILEARSGAPARTLDDGTRSYTSAGRTWRLTRSGTSVDLEVRPAS